MRRGTGSGKIKSFWMILTKKLLSDEKTIKNCSNRFRNGDFRPENTAKEREINIIIIIIPCGKKVGHQIFF